jgi:hypothetical protein
MALWMDLKQEKQGVVMKLDGLAHRLVFIQGLGTFCWGLESILRKRMTRRSSDVITNIVQLAGASANRFAILPQLRTRLHALHHQEGCPCKPRLGRESTGIRKMRLGDFVRRYKAP